MGVVSTGSLTLYDYNDQKDTNLLDYSTWAIGTSGDQAGFNACGTAPATENSIVLGIDPLGRSSPLWKCTADITIPNDADGGWDTTLFDVSDSKTYRFVVYVKRDTVDGDIYSGLYTNLVTTLGGDNINNPYFGAGGWESLIPQTGKWYVIVGYVHPYNTSITTSIGGVYDMVTGQKVANSTDYKWKQGTTKAFHRVYYYYCTTAGSTCYFWGPRVEVCDGTELPIEQLLAGSISYQYLGKFNATHPSSYNNGDYWLVYDTDDSPIQRGVYYSNASVATRISAVSGQTGYTTNNSLLAKLQAVIGDAAWCEKNGYGLVVNYGISIYFDSIAAVTAFIDSLATQYIHLQSSGEKQGAIYSGGYNEYGDNDGNPGAYIAAGGSFMGKDAVFESLQSNLLTTNVLFKGTWTYGGHGAVRVLLIMMTVLLHL